MQYSQTAGKLWTNLGKSLEFILFLVFNYLLDVLSIKKMAIKFWKHAWQAGSKRWCGISMRANSVTYCLLWLYYSAAKRIWSILRHWFTNVIILISDYRYSSMCARPRLLSDRSIPRSVIVSGCWPCVQLAGKRKNHRETHAVNILTSSGEAQKQS